MQQQSTPADNPATTRPVDPWATTRVASWTATFAALVFGLIAVAALSGDFALSQWVPAAYRARYQVFAGWATPVFFVSWAATAVSVLVAHRTKPPLTRRQMREGWLYGEPDNTAPVQTETNERIGAPATVGA